MKEIYLDHAATTPCDPAVVEAMRPFWTQVYANANSPHRLGQQARKALEDARDAVASAIGAQGNEIIFTSGGSESNNQAIVGIVQACKHSKCHVIASAIEHHCILEPLKYLASMGKIELTWIHPDKNGIIHAQQIKDALQEHTKLVIVHHANNQIGSIEPIQEISEVCHQHKVIFVVDAVQTIGHIPVDVRTCGADILTFSGHKFYGPKGIGGLYIAKGIQLPAFILGGDQERSRRAGTVNVPGAVGMAKALTIAVERILQDSQREIMLRNRFISSIQSDLQGVELNGHATQRLPNNINISFEGIDGEQLLTALDLSGIAVSLGSACTTGQLVPSHVLKAIGLSDAHALGTLRITLGRSTSDAEIDSVLAEIKTKVHSLRKSSKV